MLRGITNKDLKKVIQIALESGWKIDNNNQGTHWWIVWPPTGGKVSFWATSTDWNAHRNVGKDIERISGITVLPKNKTGRSRKHDQTEKYIDTSTGRLQVQMSENVRILQKEHRDLTLEFAILTTKGDTPNAEINRAFVIVRRIAQIEDAFKIFHQPIPEYPWQFRPVE